MVIPTYLAMSGRPPLSHQPRLLEPRNIPTNDSLRIPPRRARPDTTRNVASSTPIGAGTTRPLAPARGHDPVAAHAPPPRFVAAPVRHLFFWRQRRGWRGRGAEADVPGLNWG